MTVGGVSSRVVKFQLKAAAIALPARSFAAVVTVAVMFTGFGSVLAGLNSATRVVLLYVTEPGIAAPPVVTRSVNVDAATTLAESIGSLKVTVAVADEDTPTKLAGG
jgi:hypothetical protein